MSTEAQRQKALVRLGKAALFLERAFDARDDAIRQAHAAGVSLRAIGEQAGISKDSVARILRQ